MHCKKCLHYEVCVKLGKPSLYGINQEIGCSAYKDKAKWAEKKDTVTNADHIRAMSDEELSVFLWEFEKEEIARATEYALERRKITEWLKQPAK